jgi:dynein heavy chain
MTSKRIAFPRFFFVATSDLLDIISNGNAPEKVMKHMPKIIGSCEGLELIKEGVRPFVKGLHSCVGKEYVDFTRELKLLGKVEVYMQDILDCMRGSLYDIAKNSIKKFKEIDKYEWICQEPSMTCLLINNCNWVTSCESGFARI